MKQIKRVLYAIIATIMVITVSGCAWSKGGPIDQSQMHTYNLMSNNYTALSITHDISALETVASTLIEGASRHPDEVEKILKDTGILTEEVLEYEMVQVRLRYEEYKQAIEAIEEIEAAEQKAQEQIKEQAEADAKKAEKLQPESESGVNEEGIITVTEYHMSMANDFIISEINGVGPYYVLLNMDGDVVGATLDENVYQMVRGFVNYDMYSGVIKESETDNTEEIKEIVSPEEYTNARDDTIEDKEYMDSLMGSEGEENETGLENDNAKLEEEEEEEHVHLLTLISVSQYKDTVVLKYFTALEKTMMVTFKFDTSGKVAKIYGIYA